MRLILDEWQKEILNTKGNKLLVSGRQVGKSTIIAHDAGEFSCNNSNKSTLIISSTERQAEELFIKCLNYIAEHYPKLISKGKEKPTRHKLQLINGSVIRSLPTGVAGVGIRGYTIDRLIADEAAYINSQIFYAVTPMLLTKGGDIILVSTPHGKYGYFWEAYNSGQFKVFHINSEKAILERKFSASWTEAQREGALRHLEQEKKRMSRREYAQEYLGEFQGTEINQWFPDGLINEVCTLKRPHAIEKARTHALGLDVARKGDDSSCFEILDITDKDRIRQVENIITTKTYLNETTQKTLELDKLYDFSKIYIDDGGIGVGVFDYLLANDQTKRKVIPINNRSRPLNRDETQKKKILKEDLYSHMLMLMEQKRIRLLDDDSISLSLKTVQFEYIQKTKALTSLHIFTPVKHYLSDVTEALIRAAWGTKDKSLNLWVRS